MKVGDLVKVRHFLPAAGTVGLIVKIEEFYLMAQKYRKIILDSGQAFPLNELEVVDGSR